MPILDDGQDRVVLAEEFSEPEPNVIASTLGFNVRVLGRTGMRYTAGPDSIFIDSEVLAESGSIAVAKGSIRFWEGSDPRVVSEEERDRIAANIERAFAARGYHAKIHEPFDWDSVAIRRPKSDDQ